MHYGSITGRRTVCVSYGGKCMEMKNNEGNLVDTEEPSHLQGRDEEADTLIAFHARSVSSGNILIRSLGLLEDQKG